ncbi:MAG: hypothetical protein A3A85_01590 [Deltaproteobacteria bacterium RIFCSPLOWO2_01_FULL_42_9]|nr:MAG: hypothetical protein A3A85_01590 [Deltaproteobacteria bacterium RIFCSPLOWO2_01_FULL_42_9]
MAGHILKKGKSICIFPEGGRTHDGNLLPFKKGVGILAKEINAPLVPTYIKGTYEAMPIGGILIKPHKITITFGKPIYPETINFKARQQDMDEYEWIVSKLKEAVSAMKLQ